MFADKEKFVTSAYKKKMAEMEKLEEEEKRKEQLEGLCEIFNHYKDRLNATCIVLNHALMSIFCS